MKLDTDRTMDSFSANNIWKIIICILLICLLSPILIIIYLSIWMYREIIRQSIKRKYGTKFVEFLSGSDAFHAVNNSVARSIVNSIGFIEIRKDDYLNKSRNIPLELLKLAQKQFSEDNFKLDPEKKKIYYKLNIESGYSFWTNDNECTIDEYIRFLPDVHQFHEKAPDAEVRLQATLSSICNNILPANHTSSWEILFSKYAIDNNDKTLEGDPIVLLPIIWRFNQTLGDGISIMRLILESIADRHEEIFHDKMNQLNKYNTLHKYVNSKHSILKLQNYFLKFIHFFSLLRYLPVSLIQICTAKPEDKNALHEHTLCGQKITSMYFEQPDDNIMEQLKFIKKDLPGVRLTDLFITAISNSLEKYFEKIKRTIPDHITACVPLRVATEDITFKLKNKFSIADQIIPIKSCADDTDPERRFLTKLWQIKQCGDPYRHTPILVFSHYMLSHLCSLLPLNIVEKLARNALNSTLFISNIPGTDTLKTWNDFPMRNVAFLLQNLGDTGLGVSLLSYNNKIQLGLIADKVAINNASDADFILNEIVKEIKLMAQIIQNRKKIV